MVRFAGEKEMFDGELTDPPAPLEPPEPTFTPTVALGMP